VTRAAPKKAVDRLFADKPPIDPGVVAQLVVAVTHLQSLVIELTATLTAHFLDDWLTVAEAAKEAGVTPSCVRKWYADHDQQIGERDPHTHMIRISRTRLTEFLRHRRIRLPNTLK
jgi:hypothetical protein